MANAKFTTLEEIRARTAAYSEMTTAELQFEEERLRGELDAFKSPHRRRMTDEEIDGAETNILITAHRKHKAVKTELERRFEQTS
jgi:transcriptional regulator NrdR family protein